MSICNPKQRPTATFQVNSRHMANDVQQPSLTFYHLPAELRNQVYNHALVQDAAIGLPYAYEKRAFCEPALLLVSRLIRSEATSIFYGCNIFEAPSPASAHRFLHHLRPEKIAQLRLFRPVDLILPMSAGINQRWFDALRMNINRLVGECGKGALSAEAVAVPMRMDSGELVWLKLRDVAHFKVAGNDVQWSIEWKENVG